MKRLSIRLNYQGAEISSADFVDPDMTAEELVVYFFETISQDCIDMGDEMYDYGMDEVFQLISDGAYRRVACVEVDNSLVIYVYELGMNDETFNNYISRK